MKKVNNYIFLINADGREAQGGRNYCQALILVKGVFNE